MNIELEAKIREAAAVRERAQMRVDTLMTSNAFGQSDTDRIIVAQKCALARRRGIEHWGIEC